MQAGSLLLLGSVHGCRHVHILRCTKTTEVCQSTCMPSSVRQAGSAGLHTAVTDKSHTVCERRKETTVETLAGIVYMDSSAGLRGAEPSHLQLLLAEASCIW